jgi:hypothetical protein
MFLDSQVIEQVVLEHFMECLEEGYELDEIYESLIMSIEDSVDYVINEAKVTSDSDRRTERKKGILSKIKGAAKSDYRNLAKGAGYVAGVAKRAKESASREFEKGHARGLHGASQTAADSLKKGLRKAQPYHYSGAGPGKKYEVAGRAPEEKKPEEAPKAPEKTSTRTRRRRVRIANPTPATSRTAPAPKKREEIEDPRDSEDTSKKEDKPKTPEAKSQNNQLNLRKRKSRLLVQNRVVLQ